ncbi:hypothetical protein [Coleofasciculus sp.]
MHKSDKRHKGATRDWRLAIGDWRLAIGDWAKLMRSCVDIKPRHLGA